MYRGHLIIHSATSCEKIFRQISKFDAGLVELSQGDIVKYDGKYSADSACDEFLEVPYNKIEKILLITALIIAVMFISACRSKTDEAETSQTPEESEAAVQNQTETQEDKTVTDTELETTESEEETTEYVSVAPYYVCLYTGVIDSDVTGVFNTLDEAKTKCNKVKQLGYRVCDANGTAVYLPYTELQCDLVREGKWVTDYVRTNGFTYGDAPINPAINCDAKKVSCDRLVCWVYYRVGYTDQPRTQGLVVSNFFEWCEEHGFEKITDTKDLQPGDIVGVRPQKNGAYPAHVFLFAGYKTKSSFFRYDCGSDYRIQSVQPMTDPLDDFMCAYRPVIREGTYREIGESEVTDLQLGYACWLYTYVSKADWKEDLTGGEIDAKYEFTVEGAKYLYSATSGKLYEAETGRYVKLTSADRSTFKNMVAGK